MIGISLDIEVTTSQRDLKVWVAMDYFEAHKEINSSAWEFFQL